MNIMYLLSSYVYSSMPNLCTLQVDFASFKILMADSLSLNFWIFPLAVLGNVSDGARGKTYFGTVEKI